MKKDGDRNLSGRTLGVGALHKHFLGTDLEGKITIYYTSSGSKLSFIYFAGVHRALPDVQALESVVTHPLLVHCLSQLPIRSLRNEGDMWLQQKRSFQRTTNLIRSLGRHTITSAQAKKLDGMGLGYGDLEQLRQACKDREEFVRTLKDRGINSKPLQQKLSKHFQFSRGS